MSISVRVATPEDASELAAILNEIIAVGGTTAYEDPVDAAYIIHNCFERAEAICCHAALDAEGRIAGFQYIAWNDKLPDGWADIATFARLTDKVPGAGRALFAATRAAAAEAGATGINATIRADNTGGLTYYGKMGFEDFGVTQGVPLNDGTPVDRIHKRLAL